MVLYGVILNTNIIIKISFGGIPNSNSIHIYIYMNPYAMFGAILFAQWFCPCGQCHHQKVFKTITWLLLSRLQGNEPHQNPPEPSEPCLRNLHHHAPELAGTFRNLPEPASGTCLRNLHQHTPEPSGTFRNLPSEPAPATRTGTHRSLSGLKTPLAYAVGEKWQLHAAPACLQAPEGSHLSALLPQLKTKL